MSTHLLKSEGKDIHFIHHATLFCARFYSRRKSTRDDCFYHHVLRDRASERVFVFFVPHERRDVQEEEYNEASSSHSTDAFSSTDARKEGDEEHHVDDGDDSEKDRTSMFSSRTRGKGETKEQTFFYRDDEWRRSVRVGGKVSLNDETRRRFRRERSEEQPRLRDDETFTEIATVDRSSPSNFLDGCTHERDHFRGEEGARVLFSRGCAEGLRGETSLGVRTSLTIDRV